MNDDRDIRRSRFHVLVLGLACLAMAGLHVWRGHWLDALSNALWGLICFLPPRFGCAAEVARCAAASRRDAQ